MKMKMLHHPASLLPSYQKTNTTRSCVDLACHACQCSLVMLEHLVYLSWYATTALHLGEYKAHLRLNPNPWKSAMKPMWLLAQNARVLRTEMERVMQRELVYPRVFLPRAEATPTHRRLLPVSHHLLIHLRLQLWHCELRETFLAGLVIFS